MAYSSRADKNKAVDEIKEKLARTTSLVVADYRGMDVPKVTGLRDQFRKVQAEYKVYKNTLVKRAIAGTKMEPLGKYLEGTTAIMFSYESPSAAAKVATDFEGKQDKDRIAVVPWRYFPMGSILVPAMARLTSVFL